MFFSLYLKHEYNDYEYWGIIKLIIMVMIMGTKVFVEQQNKKKNNENGTASNQRRGEDK